MWLVMVVPLFAPSGLPGVQSFKLCFVVLLAVGTCGSSAEAAHWHSC